MFIRFDRMYERDCRQYKTSSRVFYCKVYVGYRFVTACSLMRCSVVFGVTLRLLANISSSSPAINTAAYYHQR